MREERREIATICKIFTSELGFKSGFMRGFQKGITLGGRTPGSVHKVGVVVGGGGLLDFKVYLSPLLGEGVRSRICLLYTSPSPRDKRQSRMPSSA